jgi:anti-sigma B factor antagonist
MPQGVEGKGEMGLTICARSKTDEPAMDLQLSQREKEGICVLDLDGSLTIGDSEMILRAAIVRLAETRAVNIILNLAGVTEIDEDGVSAMVFCYARIARSGGALKLLNLRPDLSLMILTKLDTVFEVFTDEQEAVSSFFAGRAVRHYDILQWVQGQESAGEPRFRSDQVPGVAVASDPDMPSGPNSEPRIGVHRQSAELRPKKRRRRPLFAGCDIYRLRSERLLQLYPGDSDALSGNAVFGVTRNEGSDPFASSKHLSGYGSTRTQGKWQTSFEWVVSTAPETRTPIFPAFQPTRNCRERSGMDSANRFSDGVPRCLRF